MQTGKPRTALLSHAMLGASVVAAMGGVLAMPMRDITPAPKPVRRSSSIKNHKKMLKRTARRTYRVVLVKKTYKGSARAKKATRVGGNHAAY